MTTKQKSKGFHFPKHSLLTTYGVLLRSFEPHTPLKVEPIALRPLKNDEVLVQMAAASINPSDLVFLRNQYGVSKTLPVVPGFEGSGTVMATGQSSEARRLKGQRVACRSMEDGNGTWAQHMITKASDCIPLLKHLSLEEGASLMVNPLTAWLLIEEAKRLKTRAFIQDAAAGALGKMLIRLGKRRGLSSICIVRKHEQVSELMKVGARAALCSGDSRFLEQLRQACLRYRAQIAFDAVGGDVLPAIADALPAGGHIVVYGSLSGKSCRIHPAALIFQNKQIRGFWLTGRLKTISAEALRKLAGAVQRRMKDDLATTVQARFPLREINEAIALYKSQRSVGKVVLMSSQ